jgi:hypothetical protein
MMIRIFFQQDGATNFVAITEDTYERLQAYRRTHGMTVQQIADRLDGRGPAISEETLIRYLDAVGGAK